jgi:hypothetical protein
LRRVNHHWCAGLGLLQFFEEFCCRALVGHGEADQYDIEILGPKKAQTIEGSAR